MKKKYINGKLVLKGQDFLLSAHYDENNDIQWEFILNKKSFSGKVDFENLPTDGTLDALDEIVVLFCTLSSFLLNKEGQFEDDEMSESMEILLESLPLEIKNWIKRNDRVLTLAFSKTGLFKEFIEEFKN